MGKSYSMDLRERLIAFVDAGHSRRHAARHFGVSESCAVKLLARRRDTGSAAPARQGRPPGGGKLAAHKDFLVAAVKENPDVTMPELTVKLAAERGVDVDPSSISRVLIKAGFSTKKKNTDGHGNTARRHSRDAPCVDTTAPTLDEDAPDPSGVSG